MPSARITDIYTDGACTGNPGPGGWGVQIHFEDGQVVELGGAERATTNNRMELQAAIAALEFLQQQGQREPIRLHTDSKYVIDGITKWIRGWQRKGWKTASGSPVLNQDLWMHLDDLNSAQVGWQWVRGHNGNDGNERCDAIARGFANGRPPQLATLTPGRSSRAAAPATATPAVRSAPTPTIPTQMGLLAEDPEPAPEPRTRRRTREVEAPGYSPEPAPRPDWLATLAAAEQIASHGWWITSAELAELTQRPSSSLETEQRSFRWRNWQALPLPQESGPLLWKLERV
jgi:ribonuclease HI